MGGSVTNAISGPDEKFLRDQYYTAQIDMLCLVIRMASGTLEPPRLRTSSAHTSSIGSQIAIVDEWKPRAMSRTRRFFVLRVYHVATCCARSSERALPEDGLRACTHKHIYNERRNTPTATLAHMRQLEYPYRTSTSTMPT